MYRSILVPLDGTTFGAQALPVALEVARRTGAVLHLVHVHAPGTAWTPLESMAPGTTAAKQVTQVEDREYLEETLAGLSRKAPVQGDVRVLDGPIGRSVAESATAAEVDLVVMSTHGRTGLSRLWHHDVAGYLTRHLAVPVLAVPVHEESGGEGRAPALRRVLVPLGGQLHNTAALEGIAEFCEALAGQATLVRVVEPPMEVGYTLLGQDAHVNHFLLEDLDEDARGYLEGAAGQLRARGIPVEVAVAHGSNPTEAILEQARVTQADVIALETHGLGTVRHLLGASVVEEVVHASTIPVLLVHLGPAAEQSYEEGIRSGMGWQQGRQAPTPPVG